MRSTLTVAATVVAVVLVATGFTDATEVEPTMRAIDGQGSLGTDSTVELYLVGGLYTHRLDTRFGCPATAGLFPAGREPAAALREVLQPTDLAAWMPNLAAQPEGSFRIATPGWVNLQIGTGPHCAWTYSVAGRFLEAGEEPGPPGSLEQPWPLWAALAAAGLVVILILRRNRRSPGDDPGANVRVIEPDHDP